ncbi:hypothetical protein [Endozoicomonas euniceicola]|uniref:Uncharacterized protein n=1 Tax=Endozoicomonas euniceicola TaxID=1234143 RepID=A0ABY6GNZ2_9GAMM|nr:hypothetical protein [Endozoicomonas euniceicola]UYM14453.1 hypothetical protein NX720_16330 [Endozoicomonas euniceicola]
MAVGCWLYEQLKARSQQPEANSQKLKACWSNDCLPVANSDVFFDNPQSERTRQFLGQIL